MEGSAFPLDNVGMNATPSWFLFAACLFIAAGCPTAQAGERGDHERARAFLLAGEILPLQTILETLQKSHPGDVLEVELEREEARWVYELKLLQRGGRLVRLKVDAKTAAVLSGRVRAQREGKADRAKQEEDAR